MGTLQSKDADNLINKLNEMHSELRRKNHEFYNLMKKRENKRERFNAEETVKFIASRRSLGTNKLHAAWRGPATIHRVIGNGGAYVLRYEYQPGFYQYLHRNGRYVERYKGTDRWVQPPEYLGERLQEVEAQEGEHLSITKVHYVDYKWLPPWYRVTCQGRSHREWREERQVPDNLVLADNIIKNYDANIDAVQRHRRLVLHKVRPQFSECEGRTVISDESLLLLQELDHLHQH